MYVANHAHVAIQPKHKEAADARRLQPRTLLGRGFYLAFLAILSGQLFLPSSVAERQSAGRRGQAAQRHLHPHRRSGLGGRALRRTSVCADAEPRPARQPGHVVQAVLRRRHRLLAQPLRVHDVAFPGAAPDPRPLRRSRAQSVAVDARLARSADGHHHQAAARRRLRHRPLRQVAPGRRRRRADARRLRHRRRAGHGLPESGLDRAGHHVLGQVHHGDRGRDDPVHQGEPGPAVLRQRVDAAAARAAQSDPGAAAGLRVARPASRRSGVRPVDAEVSGRGQGPEEPDAGLLRFADRSGHADRPAAAGARRTELGRQHDRLLLQRQRRRRLPHRQRRQRRRRQHRPAAGPQTQHVRRRHPHVRPGALARPRRRRARGRDQRDRRRGLAADHLQADRRHRAGRACSPTART